jgi:hypothetical protein
MESIAMSEVRNTKKSRLVSGMADAVVGLVADGNRSPSQAQIVSAIVGRDMGPAASTAFRVLYEDEVANQLERYFSEVCAAASATLECAHHYTSAAFYAKGMRWPNSEAEARQFVVVFGNGRTGSAMGVRFPTAEDEPDAMLLVATQKKIDVINAAICTHRERTAALLTSPALPRDRVEALKARLPWAPVPEATLEQAGSQ